MKDKFQGIMKVLFHSFLPSLWINDYSCKGWFIAEILEFRIEISGSERHQTNSSELQHAEWKKEFNDHAEFFSTSISDIF